ncbi:kinesin-like protein KIN-5C isoform X2 [Ipomoea triloba]|uniref:kinesin-like protein KIN-5C isoform X2 n=1 Tax=Ipomoea triloba TaxID=35885 RepID=UPI00125D9B45|nr:kinesin-like protein KIN-5C isoform X2 [Ipomoea triloba]
MAHFVQELRHRFSASTELLMNISKGMQGFFDKLVGESKTLGCHAKRVDEIQTKQIFEFQKEYEEQSRSVAEKLIADVSSLVYHHMHYQKELVDERLVELTETVTENKRFLDGRVTSMVGITTAAKRKWSDFFIQAGTNTKDSADFSAAKHCRMEASLENWLRIEGF